MTKRFFKNPLNRRIMRLMIGQPGRTLPILVLLSVIILFISAFFIVQSSLARIYDEWIAASNVEDGRFTVLQPLADDVKQRIEDEAGVTLFENYYVEAETSDILGIGDKDTDADPDENICIKIYKTRDDFNIQSLYDGRLPAINSSDEIAIDRCFADSREIGIGDFLTLEERQLKIVGFVALPDYSSLIRKNGDLLMDPRHFGVAVVSGEVFGAIDPSRINYQYSYIEHIKSIDKAAEHEKLEDIAEILVDTHSYPLDMLSKSQNRAISYFKDDMGGDVPMMVIMLVAAVVAIAFLFTVQANALVEAEAPVIGTLRAMGLGRGSLIFHYMLLPVCVTLFAAVFGNIGAYGGTYKIFRAIYYENYSLPPFTAYFDMYAMLMTTVIPCMIVILANYFSLSLKLNLSPLRFLRGEISNSFKRKKATNLEKFRFIRKYMIRVLLNSKGGVVAMLFGAFISSLFFMFGQMMLPIIQGYVADLRAEARSDYQTVLKMPVEVDAEKFSLAILEAEINDKRIDVRVYGISDDSVYYGDGFAGLADNEVMISSGMAERFGLASGGEIELENPFERKTYSVRISDVYEGVKSMNIYTSRGVLNRLLEQSEDYYNGYFSDEKPDIDYGYIVTVIDRNSLERLVDQFLSSFGKIANILMMVSLVFYFVIIYVLTKILIDRSKKEICYLRVFGFQDREIASVYLNSLGFVFAAFIILLVPFQDVMIKKLITIAFEKIDAYVTVDIPPVMHVVTVVLGLATFLAVRFLQSRKIAKVDMVESLKDMTM